jgi:single-strand DNA-binding protein
MASFNSATILGNLGRDPEIRYVASGKAVCNFNVATSETWKGQDGEKHESTQWHRVVVWGPQAEPCGQYLYKGSSVLVVGPVEYREWEDKEGNKRVSTEIKARSVQFLSGRSSDDQGGVPKFPAPASGSDDIPF